ncbi:hypothetical protein H0H93_007017 [Arthromyces matolae]|nr:hypothetical protein H0H93_007017 [Arthromyces matolae]
MARVWSKKIAPTTTDNEQMINLTNFINGYQQIIQEQHQTLLAKDLALESCRTEVAEKESVILRLQSELDELRKRADKYLEDSHMERKRHRNTIAWVVACQGAGGLGRGASDNFITYRISITQYAPGGLFRWVDNGGRTEKELKAEDPDLYEKMQSEKDTRWKYGMTLLPTWKECQARV